MIWVEAPSRLHFGLFNVAPDPNWPTLDGDLSIPSRRFGGVGLMIDEPGLLLGAEPADEWSAEGPYAERALAFARRFADSLSPRQVPPHRLLISRCAPEHAGLGTGTQLGLAVAQAISASIGAAELPAVELAGRIGRGERSAVGIHGFSLGGLLVDGGKRPGDSVAPMVARVAFPVAWRMIVIVPSDTPGLHGSAERNAFGRINHELRLTDALCRLVLMGLLPAAIQRDFAAFSEALADLNARSGEMFATVQGGRYATPFAAELIGQLRAENVRGVGQSSWGPAVFALLADESKAQFVGDRLRSRLPADTRVWVTRASRHGRRVI
jgi:beta-RFAP synthase